MPTIAEDAAQQHHTGSPVACAGCADATSADDIQPRRVTYVDGSVEPGPIYYCIRCRTVIAYEPADFIARADPITS